MKYTPSSIKILYSAAALVFLGCSSAKPTTVTRVGEAAKSQQNTGTSDDGDSVAGNTADTSSTQQQQTPAATPAPTPTPTPAATPTVPVVLTLTSTAFANNGAIPLANAAAAKGGMNMSIPLQWKGPPAGTASFAIQMVDLSLTPPLVHWMITDIPATSTQLPAAIPAGNNLAAPVEAKGANQIKPYGGPNPPNLHRYELTIYAIKAGQTLTVSTNSATNKTELEGKSISKSVLVGTYQ